MPYPVSTMDDALKGLMLVRDLFGPDVFHVAVSGGPGRWRISIQAHQSSSSTAMARRMGLHRAPDQDHESEFLAWEAWGGVVNRVPLDLSLDRHLVRRVKGRL